MKKLGVLVALISAVFPLTDAMAEHLNDVRACSDPNRPECRNLDLVGTLDPSLELILTLDYNSGKEEPGCGSYFMGDNWQPAHLTLKQAVEVDANGSFNKRIFVGTDKDDGCWPRFGLVTLTVTTKGSQAPVSGSIVIEESYSQFYPMSRLAKIFAAPVTSDLGLQQLGLFDSKGARVDVDGFGYAFNVPAFAQGQVVQTGRIDIAVRGAQR